MLECDLAIGGTSVRLSDCPSVTVMYNVLSGLAACGRLGVAARPACLFVRRQQTESVECY